MGAYTITVLGALVTGLVLWYIVYTINARGAELDGIYKAGYAYGFANYRTDWYPQKYPHLSWEDVEYNRGYHKGKKDRWSEVEQRKA